MRVEPYFWNFTWLFQLLGVVLYLIKDFTIHKVKNLTFEGESSFEFYWLINLQHPKPLIMKKNHFIPLKFCTFCVFSLFFSLSDLRARSLQSKQGIFKKKTCALEKIEIVREKLLIFEGKKLNTQNISCCSRKERLNQQTLKVKNER